MDPLYRDAWLARGARLQGARVEDCGDPAAELEALRRGRAFRAAGAGRLLRVIGADAVDLLHRLAASDVAGAPLQRVFDLLLTDEKGRILDLARAARVEDGLCLLCGEGRASAVAAWIERFTFTEDARGEVQDGGVVLELVGPDAASHLARRLGERELSAGRFLEPGHGVYVLAEAEAPVAHLALPDANAGGGWLEDLAAAGLQPAGDRAHALWCIETGRLRPGRDLDATMNPLEAGLRRAVSFTKGCYVGQEVVARLDSYDKVRRRPARLGSRDGVAGEGALAQGGRPAGRLLNAARLLDGEGAAALALIDRGMEEGAALQSEDGATWSVQALL